MIKNESSFPLPPCAVYATKRLPTTALGTSGQSSPRGTTSLPKIPIPETVRDWPCGDEDCNGSEEHVYASVLDLGLSPPLDSDNPQKEFLNPLDPTSAKEFDRKSSARKAVRMHHQPRSPLHSDSGR